MVSAKCLSRIEVRITSISIFYIVALINLVKLYLICISSNTIEFLMMEMTNLVKFVKKIPVLILWVVKLVTKLRFFLAMAVEEIRQELNLLRDILYRNVKN